MPFVLKPSVANPITGIFIFLAFILSAFSLINDPGSFNVILALVIPLMLGLSVGLISQLTTSYRLCDACGRRIGNAKFFYSDSSVQSSQPFFHESCYRETLRGQRRRCLNCNVPLHNPKSREFSVPVFLSERKQLFCSQKCSETYNPTLGLAVSPPIELTCPYCKSVYSSSLTKCPDCGASKPKGRIDFMRLSPHEFEQRIAELLARMGYSNVVRQGGSGDRAVDITAQRKDEFGRVLRYAVQCKRYEPTSHVGSTEMQVFCSMLTRVHGSDRGVFVTTSSFTSEAAEIAQRFAVTLVDGKLLEELFAQYA